MSIQTRLGGTEDLCLRPILPATRLIASKKINVHPAAAAAFETYRSIRVSARLPEHLASAIPVLRNQNGTFSFFSHFSERLAFRNAETIPVTFVEELDASQIARISWSEVLLLAHEQLHPKNGFRDIFRALKLVPPEVSSPIIGSINANSIAKKLQCDAGRFRDGKR